MTPDCLAAGMLQPNEVKCTGGTRAEVTARGGGQDAEGVVPRPGAVRRSRWRLASGRVSYGPGVGVAGRRAAGRKLRSPSAPAGGGGRARQGPHTVCAIRPSHACADAAIGLRTGNVQRALLPISRRAPSGSGPSTQAEEHHPPSGDPRRPRQDVLPRHRPEHSQGRRPGRCRFVPSPAAFAGRPGPRSRRRARATAPLRPFGGGPDVCIPPVLAYRERYGTRQGPAGREAVPTWFANGERARSRAHE